MIQCADEIPFYIAAEREARSKWKVCIEPEIRDQYLSDVSTLKQQKGRLPKTGKK